MERDKQGRPRRFSIGGMPYTVSRDAIDDKVIPMGRRVYRKIDARNGRVVAYFRLDSGEAIGSFRRRDGSWEPDRTVSTTAIATDPEVEEIDPEALFEDEGGRGKPAIRKPDWTPK